MNYFSNCKTWQDAKNEYKKLALKLHPDLGGDTAAFQEMLNQFQNFTASKEQYKGENETTDLGAFTGLINYLLKIDGLIIEIIGSFVWITKSDISTKDQIKAAPVGEGFNNPRWARKKKAWYFSPVGYKKASRKTFELDEIRSTFGTQEFKSQGTKKITA